jgi:aspartate oxidase
VFARRAVADILSSPFEASRAPDASELQALRRLPAAPVAEASTRAALWRDAGIVRSREGLERLLEDAHPLARLIGRSALAREESRGAHTRVDFPERDPALDHQHVVITGDQGTSWTHWE